MDDQLLNFEMMFRRIHCTAETTREAKVRLILQHQSPSLPPKAKAPAAKVTGTYMAPNHSSPPIPKTSLLNPSPNQHPQPNLSSSQILKTAIHKPPSPNHRATIITIPKTLQPKAAAAAVERRLVPSTGLTASMLQDYSDDEIDAELRHLGILFCGTTRRFDKEQIDP